MPCEIMLLTIGTRLGSHEITDLLGKGGMGEVYRARDLKLKREVAIKILPEEFSRDTDRVGRFQREAEALASLNHPNIAGIYDLAEASGTRFLVLELVEGETLADRIARGPVPVEEALSIAIQICEALEAAHERGIIHRDLKPANIKLTGEGKIKVLDFGLAKAMGSTPGSATLSNSPTLLSGSMAGIILGTAAYMSPEQASGKTVDKRTDLWAFGVVLLEMLTGRPVFEGETVSHVLAAVLTKDPDWSALPAKTPTPIRRLLRRCLEKDRKRRLDSATAARLEIEDALTPTAEITPAGAASPAASSHLAWMIAAVAVVAALALGFIHFREKPPDEPTLRYTMSTPALFYPAVAISPNGRYLAIADFTGVRADQALFIRPLDALQVQRIPETEGAAVPFWSPDSRYIGFVARGKLKKIAVTGGPAQTLCDVPGVFQGGTWNRDDSILFALNGTLSRVPAAGGLPVEIPNPQGRRVVPAFLPDGRHFLSANQTGIWVSSLDGKETRRILADVSSAAFAPSDKSGRTGHILFVREGNLMALPFDPESRQATGDVFPVTEGVFVDAGLAAASASATGVLVYFDSRAAGKNNIVWSDRSGKVTPTGLTGDVWEPAISPDEKTIAYSRNNGLTSDIYLRDLVHGLDQRFTSDRSLNNTPVWSPTGDRIVFRSTRGAGQQQLYQQSASGADQAEALTKSPSNKFASQWSKDGRFLVITTNNLGGTLALDLSVLPMGEGSGSGTQDPQKFLATQFLEAQGQISPDSHWMAYSSDATGQLEVYVRPFPIAEGVSRISNAGGQQPRWRGDGKELFFVGGDGKMMAADIKAVLGPKPVFDHGEPKPLFDTHIASAPGTYAFQYDVTADGKRFLVDTGSATDNKVTVVVNWRAGLKK
jgi:Tol biopolymer transport system component